MSLYRLWFKKKTKNPQGKNTFPFGSIVEHNQKKSFLENKNVWEIYGHFVKRVWTESFEFFSTQENLNFFWMLSKKVPRTQNFLPVW